jgi:hypothetical protein
VEAIVTDRSITDIGILLSLEKPPNSAPALRDETARRAPGTGGESASLAPAGEGNPAQARIKTRDRAAVIRRKKTSVHRYRRETNTSP